MPDCLNISGIDCSGATLFLRNRDYTQNPGHSVNLPIRCLMVICGSSGGSSCYFGVSGLFTALTYHAVRVNHENHRDHPSRYFWWGVGRLDSDPLNRHPLKRFTARPCPENTGDCVEWDPEYIWVIPGLMQRALVFSALPAFIVGFVVVRGFGHLGVSEVATFMVAMPLCIALWFYSVGWLLDRWRYKRRARILAT